MRRASMGKEKGGVVATPLSPLLKSITALFLLLHSFPRSVDAMCVLFNFGDSNSDTGALTAAFGFYLGPPYGRAFFHTTTGRWSDGRLYIDFICESLKINFMSPYIESSGTNFTHGVNFAVAGAVVSQTSANPFPIATQVLQFLHFKNKTRELRPLGLGSMISENEFHHAVYSFDIGQNDLTLAFNANLTYEQVVATLPASIATMRDAIKSIYENGGKKFWIYNTGPLGCLPQTLALKKKTDSKLDSIGCLADYNNAAMVFNALLSDLCVQLRSDYKNGTFVCIDMYKIKYDLFANYTIYGLENPLMACCGSGGPPYNYVNKQTCGQPTASPCPVGARYISWDGVHYTEDANFIISSKILSAHYSEPQIKLQGLCK